MKTTNPPRKKRLTLVIQDSGGCGKTLVSNFLGDSSPLNHPITFATRKAKAKQSKEEFFSSIQTNN